MIPIAERPSEPADFDAKVRQPGSRWLADNPNRNASDYPDYWRHAHDPLRDAFNGWCAYLGCRTNGGDVDHFIPKSNPINGRSLTYEWSNYRWSDVGFNRNHKRQHLILDPFEIGRGWLSLNRGTFEFSLGPALPSDQTIRVRAQKTVDLLNHPDYVAARKGLFEDILHPALHGGILPRGLTMQVLPALILHP